MSCKLFALLLCLPPLLPGDIQFRIYTWPLQGLVSGSSDIESLPELYYLNDRDQPQRLRIARGSVTKRYRYDGDSPLRLVKKTGEVGGEDQFAPFAQVRIQRDAEHTLLLYNPDQPRSDGQANVSVMHADHRRVPKGKGTFYNSSSQTVILNLDGESFRLAPGGAVIREAGIPGEAFRRMRVRVAAPHPNRQELKMMFTGSIRIFEDQPNLFLVQEYGERMQVRSIRGLRREE